MEVACWAHARRKFYDAQDSDGKRAAQMLALVGELYASVRSAKHGWDLPECGGGWRGRLLRGQRVGCVVTLPDVGQKLREFRGGDVTAGVARQLADLG